MHISLDGFVAGPAGEMNWIKVDDEVFAHVEKRIYTGDTAMYGRVTYRMMEDYWPMAADKPDASRHDIEHAKWYKHAKKIVLSQTLEDNGLINTTVIGNDIAGSIDKIKQQPGADILLFGSPSATHALMQLDLIDGYWLFVNPVILGQGIRLFMSGEQTTKLSLLNTRQFSSGVVELDYVVEKS